MKACADCGETDITLFPPKPHIGDRCRKCKLKRDYQTLKIRRTKLRQKVFDYMGGKCIECGEDHPATLDCHHVYGNKDFGIAQAVNGLRSWNKLQLELDKCVMLCSNCHRKYHAENGQ